MKKICTVAFLLLMTLPLLSFANDHEKGNVKITGTIMDSVSQKPVEFANVALLKADSNTPIDGAVCDMDGRFTIQKVASGEYRLQISFIGFDTKTIRLTVEKKDIDLGTIIFSPTPQVLKEVTVEGQKAIFEERVDRTIYNAENDATAKGGDATDVLKRVPLLSVDLEGNVSLRGNQNITVLINNKPSTIMASGIADALKQIPADQIKTVEVITSPSAKYDAEGSAGIINIITKKNNLEGLTLNIDAGAGLRGSNLGLNGNYRKGKMGFSLGGWGRSNYNVRGNFENEQSTKDQATGEIISSRLQSADTRNNGIFGNYNLGWDYDIDKKNSITASVRFGLRNHNNYQDNLSSRYMEDGDLVRSTYADVINRQLGNNFDANFNYTHYYDKPQRELSFQGLYSRDTRDNIFENIYTDEGGTTGLERFKNLNDSYNQEITFQADYQTPLGTNQMLEFGGKDIMRKVLSDFQSFSAAGPEEEYVQSDNAQYSNNLNYDQNVISGYLSYTLSTKNGYSFKAGSRYEHTTISAYTRTDDNIVIPSYGVLVPSVNASRKLKNGNTLKLSYNRRIQRPSIRFLNPNIQRMNNLNITQGNPQLDPEYTNNYEISYSTLIKGTMLNMSTFVRNTNDGIQSIRDNYTLDGEEVIRTTYANIGAENAYGASIFANVNIGKLSLNGGTDFYYSVLDNKNPDPVYRASNEGWVAGGRMFGSYNMSKGWGFQFFGFYRGRRVELQGTQGGFYMYSVALRKEFNEKRGSIGFGIENFLQDGIRIKQKVESPVLYQNSINTMYNMSFRINFSYRIGKMSVDGGRRGRSINNDDLKDGGDNNMGGDMGGQPGGQRGGGGNMQMGGGRRNDGASQQQQPKIEKTAADSVTFDAAGTWSYTIDSPQGGQGTIVLTNREGVYSGTITNPRNPDGIALQNIKIDGNIVSFSYPVTFQGNAGTVEVRYKIQQDEILGTMAMGQYRTFTLTGKRGQ